MPRTPVAHMQFVVGGSTYICTGTLLADTSPATQIPYFYSANHCFAEGDGAPVPARMQVVANALNTFWRYEAIACGSGVSQPQRQLAGGGVYLYRQHGVSQPRRILALRRRVPAHQRASGRRADADERLAAADPAGRADRPRRRCARGEALRQR